MLSGKKAYICSPLSAPTAEGISHNMEMAKFYLLRIVRERRAIFRSMHSLCRRIKRTCAWEKTLPLFHAKE